MPQFIPDYDVKLGKPTTIDFEVDGKKYRASVVVAVHGVIDQGADVPNAGENPAARFQYRMSLAVDTVSLP